MATDGPNVEVAVIQGTENRYQREPRSRKAPTYRESVIDLVGSVAGATRGQYPNLSFSFCGAGRSGSPERRRRRVQRVCNGPAETRCHPTKPARRVAVGRRAAPLSPDRLGNCERVHPAEAGAPGKVRIYPTHQFVPSPQSENKGSAGAPFSRRSQRWRPTAGPCLNPCPEP